MKKQTFSMFFTVFAFIFMIASCCLAAGNAFNIEQSISDNAQKTTLGFAGLGMMTGNLEAQSFFPPGKVADYTGFQYLRDNDPDRMGHNTSFLTRVANNVLYILNDSQYAMLKSLATGQTAQINEYGYRRFTFMKAFRRLLDGDIPDGTSGLDLEAVKSVSRELYALDGQISYDRAVLYSDIFRSLDATQKAWLDNMKGKGWNSWTDVDDSVIREKMKGLTHDESVAVMTYAGDLFSWYAGSVTADVYFCPERHGTYFGSFYIKDAPAIGHEGYSINEQLTATAGAALCDSTKGYVTEDQAARISALADIQRNNLYAGTLNIVQIRTDIATALRALISDTAPTDTFKSQVKALVLEKSAIYGDLDGENNYHYATVFAEVYKTLSDAQKTKMAALRKSIMSGTYSDGTTFDFSVCITPFLYSAPLSITSVLDPYISDTDYLFSSVQAAVIATAVTSSATSISSASAVLNGTVNPNGSDTSYYFEYGTTTSYGSVTASQNAGSGSAAVRISSALSGLVVNTTYHFRLVAKNSAGTAYGNDLVFRTSGMLPAVTTGSASSIKSTSAVISGTVNANGSATRYCFQYGLTTGYGLYTPAFNLNSTTGNIAVKASINGLKAKSTYHFRLVAVNSSGTSSGKDQIFTTPLR